MKCLSYGELHESRSGKICFYFEGCTGPCLALAFCLYLERALHFVTSSWRAFKSIGVLNGFRGKHCFAHILVVFCGDMQSVRQSATCPLFYSCSINKKRATDQLLHFYCLLLFHLLYHVYFCESEESASGIFPNYSLAG